MRGPVEVRCLKSIDAAEIAGLHYMAFKDFFLTSLGERFLKAFYEAVLSHPLGIGIGIYAEDKLIGFAVGAKKGTGFYKSLVYKKGLSLALAALPRLIVSPSKVNRLLTPLLGSEEVLYKDLPVLLSICVSDAHGASGIGRQLLRGFESELLKHSCHEVVLTTDSQNNDYVNRFYVSNGYKQVQTFFQGTREMNLYYRKLENKMVRSEDMER
jgi:GNAT superfamily N-acetyltransferase